MTWPTTLTSNAWTGETSVPSSMAPTAKAWTLKITPPVVRRYLAPPPEADLANWSDPRVGWGVVLLEREGLSQKELASGADAPEPIRQLLKERGNAPVFRYRPTSPNRFTLLRNYGSQQDIPIIGPVGDALPQYLLIYGTPEEISWELQYVLNASRAVGRLDLTGEALENYVQALLNGWKDASSQIDQAVVWATSYDYMSGLMHNAIAEKVYQEWSGDSTLQGKAVFLDGATNQATHTNLITTLSERKPALIVTTSHGQTGPVNDPARMKATLGLLVDQDQHLLDPAQLLAAWEPDGAIWYAHACCSAGCTSRTIFSSLPTSPPTYLVTPDSQIDQVLKGLAGLGSLTAPLPGALLGAKKPLRAFIGHVEPTFDWTIRQPANGAFLTQSIHQALYSKIYTQQPVGLAFHEWYQSLAALYTEYDEAFRAFDGDEQLLASLLFCLLAARDRQSMVILGDPTATLPRLP